MAGTSAQPPDKPTFAEVLNNGRTQTLYQQNLPTGTSHCYKGEPAVFFSKSEVDSLSAPLKHTLIGKFTTTRPSMEFLRRGFQTIGFKGETQLGLLDHRHILIRFQLEEDFHRCWLKATWQFHQYTMKMLRWTPSFKLEEEPSIVPIWINFDHLPLFLFQQQPLFSIGSLIGKPLKLDAATKNLTRPSVARLCVEIDILRPLPKRVWIGDEQEGFWQPIRYEDIPPYCSDCKSIGHLQGLCHTPRTIWKPKIPQQNVTRAEAKQKQTNAEIPLPSSSGLSTKEKLETPIEILSPQKANPQEAKLKAKQTNPETNTIHTTMLITTQLDDEDNRLLQNLAGMQNNRNIGGIIGGAKEYEDMPSSPPQIFPRLVRSVSNISLQRNFPSHSIAELLSFKEEMDKFFQLHPQIETDEQHNLQAKKN